MNTVSDFRKGDRVKFLHSGGYRQGTVDKVGRRYVTVRADHGGQMQLYPYVIEHVRGSTSVVDLDAK